ncbi:MAG TPA: hypothetical protein VGR82_17895 [Methylomirabilota bacterium]|nr:hypothetical protein [Methylomirabilota bacterium]
MACCTPNQLGAGPAADACKRVNYTLGMLLGVDDFVQESTYHTARRHELAREVLGYGTVHGLEVIVEPDGDRGPRLRITPGMAWLPSGTPVCVDTPQCANLNDWLAAHAAEVETALLASPSAPSRLSLFVVLSSAQCLTDNVPIPGEPCRSEDELMQPSRVTDGFRLELRLSPPPQREEDAIRDFVQWLLRVPVAPASPPLTEAQFVEELRRAAREWLAPTSPPAEPSDFMLGAAPAGTGEALWTTALRLWTTELRPLWMARAACGCNAPPIPPRDDALLLAELSIDLVSTGSPGGWRVSDVEPAVACDESRRPVLLSLRMVQELVTRHPGGGADGGDTVVPETSFGLAPTAGSALAYSRADHTHGSPLVPELGGDLSGPIEAARIESLQGVRLVSGSPLVDGQVLTVAGGQWVPGAPPTPSAPALAGDVTGAAGSNQIARLQGRQVNAPNPGPNQILRFVANQWVPVDLPPPPPPTLAGDVTGPAGANAIGRLQGRTLNAPNPGLNQILRFVGGEWIAVDLPTAPGGQFVGRGTPSPYQIVAAGEVALRLTNGNGVLTMLPNPGYGNLIGVRARVDPAQPERAQIALRATVQQATAMQNYIVKLTGVLMEPRSLTFRLFLRGRVGIEPPDLVDVQVWLLADQQIVDGAFDFRFQVEVSRF